jgi:hypothetical protein
MISGYTEDHLAEQPAIQLMQDELGWEVLNCFGEWDGGVSNLGRDGIREMSGRDDEESERDAPTTACRASHIERCRPGWGLPKVCTPLE